MAAFRRAWFGLLAAAVLVIACGSFSAVMACAPAASAAMDSSGCADHGGKGGIVSGCGASCLAIAPVAPAVQPAVAAAILSFSGEASALAGANAAPDPPPPRPA